VKLGAVQNNTRYFAGVPDNVKTALLNRILQTGNRRLGF
jgi:hypothetical protein